MKKFNDITSNELTLDKDSHIYHLPSDSSVEFESVTTFIARFFEKFDALAVATKLVKNSPKYMDMTVQEVLEKWKGSAIHGTVVHEEIENYILNQVKPSEPKAIHGINWLGRYVKNKKFELMTEKMVYSKELGLAGSIDMLVKIDDDKYIVMDWKTNEKLTFKSFNKKRGIHEITKDIDDCKFNLYSLQLSLYRYILERYYNLNVVDQLIIHLKDNDVVCHEAVYYQSHMIEFANLLKENHGV